MQQRVASCQIDVSAGRQLLDRAAAAYRAGGPTGRCRREIAVEFIARAARRVQLGAHHTLAATGYFEEHDAPWLFRRVHADVMRLAALPPGAGSVADVLVETDTALPAFDLGPFGESFRDEIRAFLAGQACPDGTFDPATLIPAMAERGWFGFGWPPEAGGRNASLAEQVVLQEEATYARAPVRIQLSSVMLLGNSILRHGTPAQQAAFLPLIRSGKLHFCLGYSEPEAGSDLASLKTRADDPPTATAGSSTARSSGRRTGTGPATSGWRPAPTPTRRPGTRASPCSWFRWTPRVSPCSSTGRCPARSPARSSTTTSGCRTRRGSAR